MTTVSKRQVTGILVASAMGLVALIFTAMALLARPQHGSSTPVTPASLLHARAARFVSVAKHMHLEKGMGPKDSFDEYDVDDDGYVTIAELIGTPVPEDPNDPETKFGLPASFLPEFILWIDTDEDGKVSRAEYDLVNGEPRFNNLMSYKLVQIWGHGANGTMTVDDFTKYVAHVNNHTTNIIPTTAITPLFNYMDINKDGALSWKEMSQMNHEQGGPPPMEAILSADEDEDGMLTPYEISDFFAHFNQAMPSSVVKFMVCMAATEEVDLDQFPYSAVQTAFMTPLTPEGPKSETCMAKLTTGEITEVKERALALQAEANNGQLAGGAAGKVEGEEPPPAA